MNLRILHIILASTLLPYTLSALSTLCAAEKAPAGLVGVAQKGSAEDCYQLARTYLKGDGVPKDPARAFALMKQAADEGHAEAEGGLGYLYSAGIGTAKDDIQAVAWFRKGAEKGAAKAQFNLGRMLLVGRGAAKDEKQAFQWIGRAVEQGLLEALAFQGEALFFGEHGQPQDYQKAFPLLLKAAEAGDVNAQNTVGVMLRDARGVKSNPAEAEDWFRKAAEQGHSKAQSNLGILLAGKPTESLSALEALKWLMVADSRGEITATKLLHEIIKRTSTADVAIARREAAEVMKRVKPTANTR